VSGKAVRRQQQDRKIAADEIRIAACRYHYEH
jgi:hypothetical protein